jgi:hypothetical protein
VQSQNRPRQNNDERFSTASDDNGSKQQANVAQQKW